VLSTVVWALNEAVYQIQGLAPLAKPNQLPSTPGQAQVVGTLNTVAPFGARVNFAVTNAPANGTVTIDSQGFYTYTPNTALAVAGGTDTFAVTATDTGFHLENLFGLPGHTTTIIVPVTVAPQSTQAQNAANPVYRVSYRVYNTSWATQTFGAASCNPCNGDAKVLCRTNNKRFIPADLVKGRRSLLCAGRNASGRHARPHRQCQSCCHATVA
jgi:VCBS repeat-containing protein